MPLKQFPSENSKESKKLSPSLRLSKGNEKVKTVENVHGLFSYDCNHTPRKFEKTKGLELYNPENPQKITTKWKVFLSLSKDKFLSSRKSL